MTPSINLKQLEKNTVAGIFQTGLVEIEIGLIFMVSTLAMMITTTIFLIVMVTLTVVGKTNTLAEIINPRWIISGIILSICFAIAYFLTFYRMYIYAFLLTGAFNLSEEIRENPGIISEGGYAYLLVAMVLTVIGSIYLIKFLKKYPLPEEGMSYGK